MSFSGEMKEEIARLIPEKEEEVRAELMAIIRFCGRILRQEESVAVFMETENYDSNKPQGWLNQLRRAPRHSDEMEFLMQEAVLLLNIAKVHV